LAGIAYCSRSVQLGIGAKQIDVVLRHLCHCLGAIGAQLITPLVAS
jgi:hypothetical protein